MTSKTKYSIILIAVIGLIFLIFSSIKWMYWQLEYLLIAKILYGIGIICLVLYFLAKDWRKTLTKIMLTTFSVSLVISAYLSYEHYEMKRRNEIATKYEKANCNELKELFATDLKNDEIKFFQYGMGTDIELYENLKSKYGIESFGMGCMKFSTIDCYNDLVNEHLIEKYNDSIVNGR
ncbi:sugar porter family MFS transporter [Psychroserpens algicola]|uniref:Sugar porter family MFS transporter n=1 Tax=Psychroserpens algicola TaxID=1719034 RepID=A0ABT0HDJ8_9FLAO|nr:sugar porter family MFS transporter [Psychroserpens algicola]MCK8482262.1 sugar porter family MFS transporter [Psychroserpens algicola]